MSPRKYELGRRRGAAEATREHILEATRALIGGKEDLADFSMEAVARRAGVSRMTVYYQFRSRPALLEALADSLANRGGMSELAAAFQDADPETAVRRLVGTFTRFWASDPVTLRRLRAMGIVFPSEFGGPRGRDGRRRAAIENLLARFRLGEPPGALRGRELVDLLTALTSFETFDGLSEAGRTPDAVTTLLSDAAVRLMGANPPDHEATARAGTAPGTPAPARSHRTRRTDVGIPSANRRGGRPP